MSDSEGSARRTDDPQGFHEKLARQRRLLQESTAVHDEDRELLRQWLRRKDGQVAVSSLSTYLRRGRGASERSDRPLVEMAEQDYHDLVFDLRHEYELADSTVQSYEAAILMFLKDMTDLEWPGDVTRTTVDDQDKGPSEDEILTPEDIQALTDSARHQRDVAFIEFLADTGVRITLALSLRIQDIALDEPATYTPNSQAEGLKGAPITEYPLIDSAAALRAYLETSHPRPDNPDVALFHKLKPYSREGDKRWTDDGGMRPNAMRQQLQRIADQADIEKPTNPHAFRHTAITRMAREGYSRSQIEHRVHWSIDTSMWEVYEHISSAEHNEDIFKQAGVLEDDDAPDQARRRCGTCNELVAVHRTSCVNCGQPVSARATEAIETVREAVLEALVAADDADDRAALRDVVEQLKSQPSAAAEDLMSMDATIDEEVERALVVLQEGNGT